MPAELEDSLPPKWMIALENKKRNHKLAHEVGAGAPCLKCNNDCLGLDLHFWRKICRNCKCKKELHDVKEENSFEQFEILFGENLKNSERIKKISLDLKCKLDDIFANRDGSTKDENPTESENGLSFDWIPADVPANLASEYLQQLPPDKLPITGSTGALLRRQQLQKQIPLHDFKVNNCHDLTDEETLAFTQYLDNLKNNAVGKGLITKIMPSPIDCDVNTSSRLPIFPNNLNSTPKPFKCFSDGVGLGDTRTLGANSNDVAASFESLSLEPHFAGADLKTPSAFVPFRKLNAKLTPSAQNVNLNSRDASLPHVTQSFAYNKLHPTSSTVDHLTAQYANQLTTSDANPYNLDTINNNENTDERYAKSDSSPRINPNNIDSFNNNNNNNNNNSINTDTAAKSPVENLTPSQIIRKFNNKNITGRCSSLSTPPSSSSASTPAASPREAAVRHEIVRPPNAFYERGQPHHQVATNDVIRDSSIRAAASATPAAATTAAAATSRAQNVEAKYSKLGNPEEFVALSSYVPSQPQLSNTLTATASTPSPPSGTTAACAENGAEAAAPPLKSDHNRNPRVRFGATTTLGGDNDSECEEVGSEDTRGRRVMTALHDASVAHHPGAYGHVEVGSDDLHCHQCQLPVHPGQVVVVAERAGVKGVWHPQCFVCVICQELLVDLVYFFHRGEVYCGRHYAEVLKIPRCFACDELIFLKEYTVAEGQTFHIKHFCCFECDIPLAEKSYVSKDNNPVCLPCYELKYSKRCHCCGETIKAGDSRVGWKELSWHATASCFKCVQCFKSLLGGKFVVRSNNPLCSKECIVQFNLSIG